MVYNGIGTQLASYIGNAIGTHRDWATMDLLSPFLTGRMFVRPNILRTLRRTDSFLN